MQKFWGVTLAGACAGALSGLLGTGGGMVLIPMLKRLGGLSEETLFPASVSVILPVCLTCLILFPGPIPWREAIPCLLGSSLGGLACGLWGRRIPVLWLHRLLGGLILWGGLRLLWG